LTRFTRDMTGNRPVHSTVSPDQMAPVVRAAPDGVRELVMMRWGFPPPMNPAAPLVTNIRNAQSSWWLPWLQQQHRCLVPVTSFCECLPRKPATPHWFTASDSRPVMFFAGIWRPWKGRRGTKAAPADGDHLLFSFLTTDANAMVAAIHPKAMPVLLLDEAARETWLTASMDAALRIQRPAPDDALQIVANGGHQHG
jgi:putative SOS response-associated peptidase YedK